MESLLRAEGDPLHPGAPPGGARPGRGCPARKSAGDLHTALRGRLPLSSLYRTLAVLEEARVLAKEHDAAGVARYELAESLLGHHHHLVCVSCGEVRDVGIDPPTEDTVARLVEDIARRAGYRATGHRIDIEGTCASCRTA